MSAAGTCQHMTSVFHQVPRPAPAHMSTAQYPLRADIWVVRCRTSRERNDWRQGFWSCPDTRAVTPAPEFLSPPQCDDRTMFMGATIEQLDEAEAIGAAFDASRLALVAVAVELCETEGWKRSGSRTLATWLAAYTGLEAPEARRLARLAVLGHRHPELAAALDEGRLSFGRAELLATHAAGVREGHLDASLPTLLRESERLHRFDDWASLLAHWCSYVDQDLSAPPKSFRNELHLSQSLFGQGEIHGWLDPDTLVTVSAGLEAFLPSPDPTDGPARPRTLAERRADALGDLAQWGVGGIEPTTAEAVVRPRSGVTANVTLDLRTFAGDRDHDDLDGFDLRADRWTMGRSTAERLICDAGLVATLFEGHHTVVDASDRTEQFTPAQRRALAARDRGCVFPGCDRPPKHCDAHHLHPKADGGTDRLANACLGCRHHHRLLHRCWSLRYDEAADRWVATDPAGIEWHGRPRGSPH